MNSEVPVVRCYSKLPRVISPVDTDRDRQIPIGRYVIAIDREFNGRHRRAKSVMALSDKPTAGAYLNIRRRIVEAKTGIAAQRKVEA